MTYCTDDCFVQLHSGLQSGGAIVLFLRDRVVEAYLVPQIKIISFDAYISFQEIWANLYFHQWDMVMSVSQFLAFLSFSYFLLPLSLPSSIPSVLFSCFPCSSKDSSYSCKNRIYRKSSCNLIDSTKDRIQFLLYISSLMVLASFPIRKGALLRFTEHSKGHLLVNLHPMYLIISWIWLYTMFYYLLSFSHPPIYLNHIHMTEKIDNFFE